MHVLFYVIPGRATPKTGHFSKPKRLVLSFTQLSPKNLDELSSQPPKCRLYARELSTRNLMASRYLCVLSGLLGRPDQNNLTYVTVPSHLTGRLLCVPPRSFKTSWLPLTSSDKGLGDSK